MQKSIYVSGPISKVAGGNVEAFARASALVSCAGYAVNPHDICADIPAGSPWTMYMRCCVARLALCHEVVMLPGWWRSRGARWELVIALMLGLRVYFSERQWQRLSIR